MASYLEQTSEKRYCLQDLTLDELYAIRNAIEHADLPDRGMLERIRKNLSTLPERKI